MSNDKDFKVKNGIQPTVYQEGLGTIATGSVTIGGDLANASYDGIQFDVSARETSPQGVEFKPDGTKMYIVGTAGDDVTEYTLSTAWDITSATYVTEYSVSGQQVNPRCVRFKSDGTAMYVSNSSNASITTYTLSTPWSISVVTAISTTTLSGGASTLEFWFKSDGTRIFGLSGASVFSYTLSTAWDVSTASADAGTLTVPSSHSIAVLSDGTKLYTSQETGSAGIIHEFVMTTAYDVSTGSASGVTFDVSAQDIRPYGITLKPDDTKLFMVGNNDDVSQYSIGSTLTTNTLDLSTGSVFEITPTSNIQVGLSNPAASGTVSQGTLLLDGAVNGYDLSGAAYDSVSFGVGGQETNPHGLFLKPDGTKLYITGYNGDSVDEYDLSTAWDISSASASQVFYVGSQDTIPTDVFFKPDGTKMYICGYNDQDINEYSLSTAWDISTASYSQNFSISSQDTLVTGVFFKPDGTKMYIAGDTNNSVFQYGLTTAWDISTASYESKSVASQGTAPQQLSFNNDGTKLLILDSSGTDSVYQYSCSTAYDVSTATYNSVSFAVNSQDTTPNGLFFKDDGMKMYVLGDVSNTIFQYTTGSAYTVTYDSAIQFGGGTAPDSPLANETDVLAFSTRDGGISYQAMQAIDGAK